MSLELTTDEKEELNFLLLTHLKVEKDNLKQYLNDRKKDPRKIINQVITIRELEHLHNWVVDKSDN